ncbi:Muramoyltetrapeptide carboxypeptidase [Pseudomonas amygdali pv. ulmi]|uniref:Muramoyltetrapeptide carboxypeptidase n=2 Tax=Pseudomonas syringae group genomosp. 2 TaxID=251698 RepID=A0A0Q0CR07_PSEA0|nr:Muramoyltetrapeptide carboxypeptidase [Pseudomonas amygdali pv. aesculi]KPW70502.1 Muramoyltetrapeptide carboxypeptidase [Pseudomonas amygdali pv. ciccaronei]KPY38279.1 Muramoyltetrapeptide carboxypeptidase [Pseudomonas syringae pv. rhaphiolepidis]KPZ08331.1 Muramoyltetrapeptide carboxypeptidase [Pseudomonas amygdali pv. ulmi]RMR69286.1 Muramoyltetrapeptide carboxypeptidase [Pseudomonas savastanoi pv. fraxini]RMS78740.1 Muramoyltetrapeptide carboxypeptidase [Pseudomonas savastanoi]
MTVMPAISKPTLYPKVLRAGDAVALVSPAGPVDPGKIDAAVEVLKGWGLRPRVYPHALGKYSFYSGTDEERLADLNAALADPEIRAVICNRGGYGVQRIVQQVDMDAVRRDPKLVTGFSDITALHGALWNHARLATIHGPVASQLERGGLFVSGMHHVLMSTEPVLLKADHASPTAKVRTGGSAQGLLLGGNLCILDTSVGTPFMPDMTGAILLIEEVNEPAYRVDRMLTHLGNCGILARLAGVAVGEFTPAANTGGTISPADVLLERLGSLGIPVLGGLPVGHGDLNQAVPLGTQAILDADAGTLLVSATARS